MDTEDENVLTERERSLRRVGTFLISVSPAAFLLDWIGFAIALFGLGVALILYPSLRTE